MLHVLPQLNQVESQCTELEAASSKAICEITSLNEEMEGLKVKEGAVEELQKQMQDVEMELELKQGEVSMPFLMLLYRSDNYWN